MRRTTLLLILFCLLFVIAKIQHLSLPFFWDEAWPYSTGVFYMYTHGLSLLPGSIPFDISRGHPLFFHFLSALWMNVFGASLVSIHTFSLLLSICLVVCIYFFCKEFFTDTIGLISCLLLLVQPVFFSQSAMLLPEIPVALLTLLSFWTFLRKRKLLYVVFATLLLLTKESGIVLIIALSCRQIFDAVWKRNEPGILKLFAANIYLILPVVIASGFFILQKIETGHFFLPMYVSEDNFRWTAFTEKLKNYFAYIFIYQGRNVLSAVLLVSISVILFRKLQISSAHKRIIFSMTLFITFYVLFSSLSFYSPRYMLSVFPFFMVISSFLIFTAIQKKIIYVPVILCITTAAIFYCFRKKPVYDHSPGFADAVSVTQNVVDYCEKEKMYDKKIYSNFLMRTHLTHPEHGYLSAGKKFNNVAVDFDTTVSVYIFSSYEPDGFYPALKSHDNFKLTKKFEKNYARCEVYEKIN